MLQLSESQLTNESVRDETAVGTKELMLLFSKCQCAGVEATTWQSQHLSELLLQVRLIFMIFLLLPSNTFE